jgi:hypothetical protein
MAVKFDRYFVDRGKKTHEVVTITSSLMRVEGSDYTYVLDMTSSKFIYAKNSSNLGIKIPFREIIKQIKKHYLPLKQSLGKMKVDKAGKPEKYKRVMTLKATIVQEGGGFIVVRFVKKNPHNIFVRKFFESVYLKLGILPVVFTAGGVPANNKFNEMATVVSTALDYDSEGMMSLPIYTYNSKTVSQVDLSNIHSTTSTKEMMYKGVISVKKELWYAKYIEMAKKYYNIAIETTVHLLFGKTTTKGNSGPTQGKKIDERDLKHVRVRKGIDYSMFWSIQDCKFRKLRKRLLFMSSQTKGLIFEAKTVPAMKQFYKQMLDYLGKYKYLSEDDADAALRKKFRQFIRAEGYKRAKVKKTSLVKPANLCYLHGRLYKKYSFITKKKK